MAKVFLSLGSNIDAGNHILQGLQALAQRFGHLQCSPVYESESVGFDGDNFLNLVVAVTTHLSVGELLAELRAIEAAAGRDRTAPKFSSRSLDIDILTYDDRAGTFDEVKLPRGEILKNAFVLKPFCDLAPNYIHPLKQQTIAELWAAYDKSKQQLWPVDFVWQGENLSARAQ